MSRLIAWLTQPVQDPGKWAFRLFCPDCGWHISPNDRWRIMDTVFPPNRCPDCRCRLKMKKQEFCPNCRRTYPPFHFPKNVKQLFWGARTCPHCQFESDKWGRKWI